MVEAINIDPYFYGYNVSQVNCIDIPIAGACGSYNYDNYFFYCAYISLFSNWVDTSAMNFMEVRNKILRKFGLEAKPIKIEKGDALISLIKQEIDAATPLLMLSSYSSLYYTPQYQSGDALLHGTIISGYNSNKNTIVLTEIAPFNTHAFSQYITAHPLYTIYLTEKILLEVWEERNKYFRATKDPLENTIYKVEKIAESDIKSYKDIINDIIENYEFNQDNLTNLVVHFSKVQHILTKSSWLFKVKFIGGLHPFFRCIEEYIRSLKDDNEIYRTKEVLDNYLNARSTILSSVIAQAHRNKYMDTPKKYNLIMEIDSINNELHRYIKTLHHTFQGSSKQSKLVNFAIGAQAIADSEFSSEETVCRASNAINGKWQNWVTDQWQSDGKEKEHWLKIDLLKPQKVVKFVIRHAGVREFNTVDFKIMGSSDNQDWDKLVEVQGNKEYITIHEVNACTYRHFMLYITKPCQYDFNSRIYEFEIWGVPP